MNTCVKENENVALLTIIGSQVRIREYVSVDVSMRGLIVHEKDLLGTLKRVQSIPNSKKKKEDVSKLVYGSTFSRVGKNSIDVCMIHRIKSDT